MLAKNVQELGCTVTDMVTNGEEAVLRAKETQPDAILMDINLDGPLDGIETARIIRAEQEVPILFFTGYLDPSLYQQTRDLNPSGIVNKLDTTEAIKETISSLLQ